MKKFFAVALTGLFVIGTAFVYKVQEKIAVATGIMEQLGIDPAEARHEIFINFKHRLLATPSMKYGIDELRDLATGKKAAYVKMLGDYIKRYTQSPEFKRKFETMAHPPSYNINGMDDLQKLTVAGLEADLAATSPLLAKTTGEDKAFHQESISLYKNELEKQKDAITTLDANDLLKNPEKMVSDFLQFIDKGQSIGNNASEIDEQYKGPATLNALIKQRLQDFLDFTADMDFNAKLVGQDGIKKFADPALEDKPRLWKFCFRAGRETIEAAREYAKTWLSDLEK